MQDIKSLSEKLTTESENTVRKLGLAEEQCKILAEYFREEATVLAYLRIEGNLTADIAITAFNWLQKRYPLLRCNFAEYDSDYNQFDFSHYLSVKEEDRINEVPLTVIPMAGDNHWQEVLDTELHTNFPADLNYLWRATLLSGDGIHDLILKVNHAITDGTSWNYLFQNFLTYCADLAEGCSMPKNFNIDPILPPLEELLPKQKNKSLQIRSNNDIKVSPWQYQMYQPLEKRHTGYILHALNLENFHNLQQACEQQNVSLNSALSVAFINAVNAVLGEEDRGQTFRTLCLPLDLRLSCKPKVKPYHLGFFANVIRVVHPVTDREKKSDLNPFWDSVRLHQINLMKEIKKYITGYHQTNYKKKRIQRNIFYVLSESDKKREFLLGPEVSCPFIKITEKIRNFEIKKLFFFRPVLSGMYPIRMLVYPFAKNLNFVFDYTEGLVKNESVSAIIDIFLETLKEIEESFISTDLSRKV